MRWRKPPSPSRRVSRAGRPASGSSMGVRRLLIRSAMRVFYLRGVGRVRERPARGKSQRARSILVVDEEQGGWCDTQRADHEIERLREGEDERLGVPQVWHLQNREMVVRVR